MSAATPHSVYEDPRNPSSFLSEPHSFYSSDGTTTEPLWNGDAHITSPSDLSGLFVDSGNLNWPEVDSTDYSPGTYSDSDRQTGFSSGLSSNSSPDDFLELQAEYSQYENGPGWNQYARYTAGLSPSSEFHNLSEPNAPFGGSTQTYLSEHPAYRDAAPDQCISLSQLVNPSQPQGLAESLSIETVAPRRSAKSNPSSPPNGSKKKDSDDDDDEGASSDPSSSDYCPSPSPGAESKQSIRHHPYNTVSRPKELNPSGGTAFRAITPRTRRSSDRPCAPIPVPVPNLTKKSRGRKVPTVHEGEIESDMDDYIPSARQHDTTDGRKTKKGRGGSTNGAKGGRTYKCTVEDCGKCFIRGEHLKRHIRSIHTNEKPHPCPYEGCDRTFSRRDNLGQHQRVHGL